MRSSNITVYHKPAIYCYKLRFLIAERSLCLCRSQCAVLQDICKSKKKNQAAPKRKKYNTIPVFHPLWLSESAIYCRQGENDMLIGNK